MATVSVFNKTGDVLADALTVETFVSFKKRCGKGSALIVVLECGAEIMVDTLKIFRKLPRGEYRARLLRSTTNLPKGFAQEAGNYDAWIEV